MEFFIPAVINVDAPPRGTGDQSALTFKAQSINATFAWGSSPGTATIIYIGETAITRGSRVLLTIGKNFFAGICQSDVANVSAGGNTRTLQFVDFRDFLTWDYVFCSFNKAVRRTVNGRRLKQYRHVYPADSQFQVETYTNSPLLAWQMIAAIFGAPTVGTPWSWDFTSRGEFPSGVLNAPVYDFDALNGKRLDAALNEICGRAGIVFTLVSTPQDLYHLVFTRKGFGALPPFPASSDDRNLGDKLSGNPTNVRIYGDRNLYQVMDAALTPDWSAAWQQYFQVELFAEDLFLRATDPQSNQRYNAITGDTEKFIGRNRAMERALRMTVREYVALRNAVALAGDNPAGGDAFADTKLYAGRSRMDMPVALYLQTLLYRAFRPVMTGLKNRDGVFIPIQNLALADRQLCRVSHDPVSGAMTAYPAEPVDGNGYAITKGFQVGEEFLRQVKPADFDPAMFAEASPNRIWSTSSFQIDSSGEGTRFVIFDQPIVVSTDLMIKDATTGNIAVINAAATLTVPTVKAALTFEAERYSSWWGVWPNVSRDTVENVPSLQMECVLQNGVFTELPYEDGKYAADNAQLIANALLARQYAFYEGGYKDIWKPTDAPSTFGSQLSSMVDRIQIESGAKGGTFQVVDFASERERDYFEPERDLERRTVQNTLFPGQMELRSEADQFAKLAETFRQMPKDLKNLLARFLRGQYQPDQTVFPCWFKPRASGSLSGTMLAGTPLFGTRPEIATYPPDVSAEDVIFIGVTTRHNEPASKSFHVQNTGMGYARVQGPISENDPIGFSATAADSVSPIAWLVKNGSPTVGKALQKITDNSTQLIKVMFGSGGGGTSSDVEQFRFKSEHDDYLICHTWDGVTEGATDVIIAKIYLLRYSVTSRALRAAVHTYTYDRALRVRTDSITDAGLSEKQWVIPGWATNDLIYAMKLKSPLLLIGDFSTGTISATHLALDDGRAWCRKTQQ